jgi:hypothetical protein
MDWSWFAALVFVTTITFIVAYLVGRASAQ